MNQDIYTIRESELPPQLKQIPQPPSQLYIQGKLPHPETRILTVVGPRRPSCYGEEVVKKLISGLIGYNICIVSGLAIGIDGMAHKAALNAGLQTIAFPGSGLHPSVLYPSRHLKLADEILYAGGAIISELDILHPSLPWTFPQRNRLMAGIAHATLVIEGSMRSGSLLTTRLAMDYNREVGAVPGPITSYLSEGPNYYIKNGATPITGSEDILQLLGFSIPDGPRLFQKELLLSLTSEQRKIVDYLQIEPMSTDYLMFKTGYSVQKLNELLSNMEIQGIIKEKNGRFQIC